MQNSLTNLQGHSDVIQRYLLNVKVILQRLCTCYRQSNYILERCRTIMPKTIAQFEWLDSAAEIQLADAEWRALKLPTQSHQGT